MGYKMTCIDTLRSSACSVRRQFQLSNQPNSRMALRYTRSESCLAPRLGAWPNDQGAARAAQRSILLPKPLISTERSERRPCSSEIPPAYRAGGDMRMCCSPGVSFLLRAIASLHRVRIMSIMYFPCLVLPLFVNSDFQLSPSLSSSPEMRSFHVVRQIRMDVSHSSAAESKARFALLTARSVVMSSLTAVLILLRFFC
ncbi:hypothetical protein N431DRAFT_147872 [Stipitochalara longipes BDJ]|nr:hypothetical protein N431DRAFT_147872 [Stipitochalara longipes BDJ]